MLSYSYHLAQLKAAQLNKLIKQVKTDSSLPHEAKDPNTARALARSCSVRNSATLSWLIFSASAISVARSSSER